MSATRKCPACDSEISAGSSDGLCLKCLGKLGFQSTSEPANDGSFRLGGYDLLEEIARGGMGVVYRARQVNLNRIVALKVVLHGPFSSPEFVQRFRKEAEVAASLHHPNIVPVYEVGEDRGSHFLALEYVEGRSLAGLASERPLPARRAAAYLKTIASAVEYAHQQGVLHRDLKPSNILLDSNGEPHVTDFGLAKLMSEDAELTATGAVLGSPSYMSPEQASGKADCSTPRSDIYSLGAILYEVLTGRPPFQGETLQSVLAQVQRIEPVRPQRLNPNVPLDLQTICLKCLQKEPSRRYSSARELAEDLQRFLDDRPISARPVSLPERAVMWCRRRPRAAAMIVAMVAVTFAGMAGIVWQWRKAEAHALGEMQQRLISEKTTEAMRLNLYAADMAVASHAIQNGNLGLAEHTLEAWVPKAGVPDVRGFDWRYLRNRCQGEQVETLVGHTNTVTCVAFSPDGTRLASGGLDGTVRIWKVPQHELIITIPVKRAAWSLAFTADGKYLVIGASVQVEFRDTSTWEIWRQFPGTLATVSTTGSILATSGGSPFFWEEAGPVTLWDWRSGKQLRRLEAPGRALSLSSDAKWLAVGGPKSGIRLYDTTTGNLEREWPTTNCVWSFDFSLDDAQLLYSEWSSDILIRDIASNGPPRILAGNILHTWSARFSRDGKSILTSSSDQSVGIWDTATLKQKSAQHGHRNEVWCAAYSPDEKWIATGGKDQNVMLWAADGPRYEKEIPHDSDFRPLLSPAGQWLVTVNPLNDGFMLWDADTGLLISSNVAGGHRVCGFSHDGELVATLDVKEMQLFYWRFNGKTPDKTLQLEGGKNAQYVWTAMSPGQDFFVAINDAGTAYLWNTADGHLLRTIQGPKPPIRNAIVSSFGKKLAIAVNTDDLTHLYDCATGTEQELAGHRDFVSGLAFSPDVSTLATGSMDGSIRLWNSESGKSEGILPGHMQETSDLAFSPDGRTLISLGHRESLKLWDILTLREVVSESEPQAGIWLALSQDGTKLAMESSPNELRLLRVPAH